MNTTIQPTAGELVSDIVSVLDRIRSTQGIPAATRERCDHSLNSIHESMHGLTLWLRELLQWAPLAPETRASVVRLASDLGDADSGFHPSADSSGVRG